jgi:hypothetical protein
MRSAEIGSRVIFTDSVGQDHEALVTNNFGTAINVVYVSGDAARTDSYGRQVERATSIQHVSVQTAPGYYWRHVDEERKQDAAPNAAREAAAATA